jgi:hypothetical protein
MYVNNNNVDTPLMYLTDYKGVRTMYWTQLPLLGNLVLGWVPVLKDFILDSRVTLVRHSPVCSTQFEVILGQPQDLTFLGESTKSYHKS